MRLITSFIVAAGVSPFLIASPTAHGALSYSVRAIARASTSGNITNGDSRSTDTQPVAANSIEAGPLGAGSNGTLYTFSASAHTLTEVGKIHGSVSVSAVSTGPAGGGSATAQGIWTDSITITSSTLPANTPVSFLATATLHRTLTGTGGTGKSASAFLSGPFGLSLIDTLDTPNSAESVSTIVNTAVGQVLSASQSVIFSADASNSTSSFALSASVDAENTVIFTFTPITPGATYTTASGATFIPEPSLGLGLAGSLLLLGGRRRR